MDNLLTKLGNLSEVKSVPGLSDSIHVAKESVKIHAIPVHERRAKCFTVFQQALSANKPKLSLAALEGLQLTLREPALLNESTTKKPEDALSIQMLKCLEPLPEWDKQIQCQILTVIVQLISSNEVSVSLNDVYEALQICTKTFKSEEVGVKLAVRASITQMLNSFCSNRHNKVFQHSSPSQEEIAVLMDTTALLTEVYRRLSSADTIDELQLGLDSVYSVLSAQPDTFHKHPPLLNVFSTELVPCLLCLLHSADDKPAPSKSLLSMNPTTPLKFNVFSLPESARSFYQVVEQVIRLLSRVPDSEPLALELLRNSLLSPHISRRSEALKLLKRLFSTPSRFVEFLDLCVREPQFWPVVLSCLEECSKVPGSEGAVDSIRIMTALFNGLCIQLHPSNCDKYSPIVHQILENALKAQNSVKIQKSRLHIVKRRQTGGEEAEQLAHEFLDRLGVSVKEWIKEEDMHKIDKKIQEFAAQIAQEFTDLETDHNQTQSLLNTDAVYLTTFAVLSFCLHSLDSEEPDQSSFFGQVIGSGCIVYANDNWLSAIYDLLHQQNIFDGVEISETCSLFKLIEDYDGKNCKVLSAFLDEDYEEGNGEEIVKDERYVNFENWIRNQLASSWSTFLSVLTKFSLKLDKKGATDKLQTDGVEATLEATTSLLKLLLKLRLSSEITWVFERIGEEVCLLEDLRQFVVKSTNAETKKPWRINRIDALSIGLLLDNCIECGTLSPSSWKHTVRTIEYVCELEKYLFRLTKTANVNWDTSEVSLGDLLSKIVQNELSLATVGRVLDELMLKIDGFFEDAPKILNLPSMCALLAAVCTADEDNLRNLEGASVKIILEVYVPACSLSKIARLVGGNVQRRLLAHRMRIWGSVKDHYVETISSKFPSEIARLSISALNDSIRALLGIEPSGSSFHQSLFTAYQTTLCSDVCSAETQEQIVANLASFIEDSPLRIGSGWKPLFGALKAIRISPAKQKIDNQDESSTIPKSALTPANYAVIGVFRRYIEIGDPHILIPTALEFIHCVVHYLQSTEGFEQLPPNPDFHPSTEHERDTQFGQTAFSFVPELKRQLLVCFEKAQEEDLEQVPAPLPILNRLRHREQSMEYVEESLVDAKLEEVGDLSTCLHEDSLFEIQPSRLNEKVLKLQNEFPWEKWTNSQKCVVELLLSLVDELAGLALTCSRQILSQLLIGIVEFVGSLQESKLGLPFGVYALCSNILPLLQKWARREHKGFVSSAQIPQSLRNLKQTTTIFTELTVDYVRSDPQNEWNERLVSQILILFNDLISHASPFVAGTGSACLRHFISSLSSELSTPSLTTICASLWQATSLSLAPIRKLIGKFVANSVDVNGDIGEVHVIVKEDVHSIDYTELRAMALQIFQIENREQQATRCRQVSLDEDGDDKKRPQFAYVFVFRPKTTNSGSAIVEKAVTMDEIVAGLMSTQSLLQLFSLLLLGTSASASFTGESEAKNLSRTMSSATNEVDTCIGKRLTRPQMGKIVACLDAVNFVSGEFDSRPSLKYLLQKLINGEQVANLYKLQVASQAIKLQTVYELAKQITPTRDDVIKVTKGQGVANPNLTFLRLLDSLTDQTLAELEDLEGQALKSPSAIMSMRDRVDMECGQLRLSEDFESSSGAQPQTPKTPTARTNPFLNRIQSLRSSTRTSTDSTDGLQMAQLSDLDLHLIAQSEIIAILIERAVREEQSVFRVFLPLFSPKVRKLMLISAAKRSRFACAEFLNRLDQEWETST